MNINDVIGESVVGSSLWPVVRRPSAQQVPCQKTNRDVFSDLSFFLPASNSPKNHRYRQSGTLSTYCESPTHDDEKTNSL